MTILEQVYPIHFGLIEDSILNEALNIINEPEAQVSKTNNPK